MALFFLAGLGNAFSETALELVDRTQKELQARYDAKGDSADVHQEKFALQVAISRLQTVRQSLLTGNGDAMQNLVELREAHVMPEASNTALDTVIQQMRAARADQATAYTTRVDTACRRAAGAILQAKEPKDLDATIHDLAAESEEPAVNRYDDRSNNHGPARLKSAIRFATMWQDYLLASSRHEESNVRAILHNLINNSEEAPLIPRSEVLAREPETDSQREASGHGRRAEAERLTTRANDAVLAIVQGAKTLADVPAALAKLADLRQDISSQPSYGYGSDSALGAVVVSLESLRKTSLEIQSGLTEGIDFGFGRLQSPVPNPQIEVALLPLRGQLIEEAAPRLMHLPADEKPAADEPVGNYLHRLIEAAKARQDWTAVVRGLQIMRSLSSTAYQPSGIGNESEITAYQNLVAANNLEQAGQYEEAVNTYLIVLRSGQENLPATWIGEHLAAIQKAHPGEFAHGTRRTTEDMQEAYGEYLRAVRSLYDPGKAPMPGTSPSPALPTPTPAPTPTVVGPPTAPSPK